MKSFVALFCLVAAVAADVSHLVGDPDKVAQVVQNDAEVGPESFRYAYKTSNGIAGEESGALKQVGPNEAAIAVQGANSYTSPEGIPIQIQYTADETGYHPQGAHLPTPPPPQEIPEYIQRAIAYIQAHPQPENIKQRF